MSDTKAKKTNRRFSSNYRMSYTIMFLLIVVFAVLTWIVPSGQYQRKTISTAAGERPKSPMLEPMNRSIKHYRFRDRRDHQSGREISSRVLQAPTKGI